jgi:lipoprotein-anchoring transpeptidase ErfK/SrfK
MKRLSGRWPARLLFAGITMAGLTIAALTIAGLASTAARADVLVQIDKSSQRMAVSVDGAMRYEWPVSTGRNGYGTPSGTFHPQSMSRHYFSRKYYNAPMPHAIFFYGGFAIHGTNDLARLGGPASHGCVRLHPSHAAALFALVERNGPRHTRIEISN